MRYLFLILLTGCVTSKKVTRYLNEHPLKAAEYCSKAFPVRDSVVTRDSVHLDTLYIECPDTPTLGTDTITITSTKKVYVPCVSKTIYRDSTIYRRDFARETVLEENLRLVSDNNLKLHSENQGLKLKVMKLQNKNVLLWLLIILLTGFSFRRQIGLVAKRFL